MILEIINYEHDGLTQKKISNYNSHSSTSLSQSDIFQIDIRLNLPLFLTIPVWIRHGYSLIDIRTTLDYFSALHLCRESSSVTMKASFEKVMETFINGAAQSHVDTINGCMDVICWTGRLRAGTGRVELFSEPVKVPKYISDSHDRVFTSRFVGYIPPAYSVLYDHFIKPKTNRITSEKSTPLSKIQVTFTSLGCNIFRPTSPSKNGKHSINVLFSTSNFRPWTP